MTSLSFLYVDFEVCFYMLSNCTKILDEKNQGSTPELYKTVTCNMSALYRQGRDHQSQVCTFQRRLIDFDTSKIYPSSKAFSWEQASLVDQW